MFLRTLLFPLALMIALSSLGVSLSGCGGDDESCATSAECSASDRCVDGTCRPLAGDDAGADSTVPDVGGRDIAGTDTEERCISPRQVCGGDCVDATTDPAHCGGCGQPCAEGEPCAGGVCQSICEPTEPPDERCDGADNDCDGETDFPGCDTGLIAWYRMERDVGGVFDTSSTMSNGVVMGTIVRELPGRIGNAFRFDGMRGTLVSVPDTPALVLGDQLTIEAWVNPEDCNHPDSSHNSIVAKEGEFLFRLEENTCRVSAVLYASGVARVHAPGPSVIVARWSHVAMTWDGAEVQLYVDGLAAGPTRALTGDLRDRTTNINIGRRTSCDCLRSFRGLMDEVKIWNTARTEQQICESAGGVYTEEPRDCDL